MISVIISGKFLKYNKEQIKIGGRLVFCGKSDMRFLNTTYDVGINLVCLCSLEDKNLYYRFADKNPSIFVASGVLDKIKPSVNPKYITVYLIEEHVCPEGDKFDTTESVFYVDHSTDVYKKLRKVRFGDALSFVGVMIHDKKDNSYLIVKDIITTNTFVVLSGLEQCLPFDDLRKEVDENLKTDKKDF